MDSKEYIFLTIEGHTLQPDNLVFHEDEIDNIQVVGFGSGANEDEAFQDLIKHYSYLLESKFNEVFCYELDADYKKTSRGFFLDDFKEPEYIYNPDKDDENEEFN